MTRKGYKIHKRIVPDPKFKNETVSAFINGLIPSEQRATVLSFDSLMASAGGVVAQPGLGRVADVFGYPTSYLAAASIQALAVPFVLLARRENAVSDPITEDSSSIEALRTG